jgi:hypothetical protein
MTKLSYYRVRSAMLFSILVSNGIGVAVVLFLTQRSISVLSPEVLRLTDKINQFFLPASFILPWVFIRLYERPVRVYLKKYFEKKPLPDEMILKARQKLLNEPFFLISLAFGVWMAAAAGRPTRFCS